MPLSCSWLTPGLHPAMSVVECCPNSLPRLSGSYISESFLGPMISRLRVWRLAWWLPLPWMRTFYAEDLPWGVLPRCWQVDSGPLQGIAEAEAESASRLSSWQRDAHLPLQAILLWGTASPFECLSLPWGFPSSDCREEVASPQIEGAIHNQGQVGPSGTFRELPKERGETFQPPLQRKTF